MCKYTFILLLVSFLNTKASGINNNHFYKFFNYDKYYSQIINKNSLSDTTKNNTKDSLCDFGGETNLYIGYPHNDIICYGTQINIFIVHQNYTPQNEHYQWSYSNLDIDNITVTPTLGNSTFTVTITNQFGCTRTDSIRVVANEIDTVSRYIIDKDTICPNDSVNIRLISPYPYGKATEVTTTPNNINTSTPVCIYLETPPDPFLNYVAHNTEYNMSNFISGTYTSFEPGYFYLHWWINDVCHLDSGHFLITVLPYNHPSCCSKLTASAGPDKTLCGLSYNLNGVSSMGAPGYWTALSSGAVISNPTSSQSLVSVTAPGSYDFIYHTGEGNCFDTDTVTITFTQAPIANAGNSGQICSFDFNMEAIPSIGTGTWTCSNPLVIFSDLHNPNSEVSVPEVGEYVFTWTEYGGGTCYSTDYVIYDVGIMPNADAGVDGAACSLNYLLNANSSTGNGSWTYSGPGNIMFSDQFSPQSYIFADRTGSFNFIWTENNNGCIDKDSVTITMTQTPSSEFDAEFNCNGDTAFITFTGIGNIDCVFDWDFDGGQAFPVSLPGYYAVNYPTPGTFNISLQVSQNGCFSDTSELEISSPDPLTIDAETTDLLCFGEANGMVSINVEGGFPSTSGTYTYLWSNNNSSATITGLSGGTYTVTVTDTRGCTITNQTYINEPTELILMAQAEQMMCAGEISVVSLYASGGTGSHQFMWNGQPSSNNFSITMYHDSTFAALVSDDNGCTDEQLVNINISDPIDLIIVQNTDSVCPGNPAIMNFIILSGSAPPFYLHDQFNNVISPPLTLYPLETTQLFITAHDACGTQDTDTALVFVFPDTPPVFTADINSGCQPLEVQFHETSIDSNQTFMWDFGDFSDYSSEKDPLHVFEESGVFDVILTATSVYGCKTTEIIPSFINVYPKPQAQFTWEPDFASVFKPFIQFTNLNNGAVQHFWFFGDNDSSSIFNPYHRFPAPGNYDVSLIAISDKGCKDTAIANILIKDDFTLYAPTAFSPDNNGINEIWYVTGYNIEAENFHLFVYDRWGQVVWETNKYNPSYPKQFGWDGKNKAGNIVKVDTYTWYLICKDFKGNKQEFTGAVTVIR